MFGSSKVLDALKTIGLNLYERKIWVALLSRGMSTAGELSDMSNVPRSRCYDVLESLAERGFVVIQPGKPIKYVAIDPAEALERAKKKLAQQALEMTERIDDMKKSPMLKELDKIHKQSIKVVKPEDLTGALRGRYALTQQMSTMFKGAKKSINVVTTEEGIREMADKHMNVLEKAKKSGVDIKIIAPVTKQTKEAMQLLSKVAKIKSGNDIEHISKARMLIVDGDKFIMALTHDEQTHPTQDVAFWTESSHAAGDVVLPMFNLIWDQAKNV